MCCKCSVVCWKGWVRVGMMVRLGDVFYLYSFTLVIWHFSRIRVTRLYFNWNNLNFLWIRASYPKPSSSKLTSQKKAPPDWYCPAIIEGRAHGMWQHQFEMLGIYLAVSLTVDIQWRRWVKYPEDMNAYLNVYAAKRQTLW